jgi:DNA primase
MSPEDLHKVLVEMGLNPIQRNNNYMCLCPAHKENSPSWGISLSEPHLHACFACGFKGTLATLLRKSGQFSEKKIRILVGQTSSKFTAPDFELREKDFKEIDYRLLFPYPMRKVGLVYMLNRGVSGKTIKLAKLGYDHTQKRVLFPWFYEGRLIGVTGRAIHANPVKVLPYFGTLKGQCLYLPFGRIRPGPLVIVEGEVDALMAASCSSFNVGALGFGSFTPDQKNLVINS